MTPNADGKSPLRGVRFSAICHSYSPERIRIPFPVLLELVPHSTSPMHTGLLRLASFYQPVSTSSFLSFDIDAPSTRGANRHFLSLASPLTKQICASMQLRLAVHSRQPGVPCRLPNLGIRTWDHPEIPAPRSPEWIRAGAKSFTQGCWTVLILTGRGGITTQQPHASLNASRPLEGCR